MKTLELKYKGKIIGDLYIDSLDLVIEEGSRYELKGPEGDNMGFIYADNVKLVGENTQKPTLNIVEERVERVEVKKKNEVF